MKMLPMELDHIFLFTQNHVLLAESLKDFGLIEGTPNEHPGQGTACRRFFFQNAYLELAWVVNEVEIKSSALAKSKLFERSQYPRTPYSPLGLCFRTNEHQSLAPSLLFEDSWRYYSNFLPKQQFANIASNENFPDEPMLFEMPFFSLAPVEYPIEKKQSLTHIRGFQEITGVLLTLPTTSSNLSSAMNIVLADSMVKISKGKDYGITLEFDFGKNKQKKDFFPLAPLILKW
ncbi:VOC family protein [Adhaeribacter radiodurans]|uniref:Uncharacterized protein n=1 Tax=Adhaeribacter radiodurans TaxID=2745197 RepID=A0A7L7L721_9BACT|nr:hypothetical protein [Adhaeribacter radiodurans]QMU28149.1 hypothetical protein HUW48_08870 [Adhaeribacter radiodurans]